MTSVLRLLVAMWLGTTLEVAAELYPVELLFDRNAKLAGARNLAPMNRIYLALMPRSVRYTVGLGVTAK